MKYQVYPLPFNVRESLEPWIDKDVWEPEEAAEFLALGERVNLKSEKKRLEKNFPIPKLDENNPTLYFSGRELWDQLWASEGYFYQTLELTRTAVHPVTGCRPKHPKEWCDWAKLKGFETVHIERHLSEGDQPISVDELKSPPVGGVKNPAPRTEFVFLAQVLKQMGFPSKKVPWNTVKRKVVQMIKEGEDTPFELVARSHFGWKGSGVAVEDKTIQNWLSEARKIASKTP